MPPWFASREDETNVYGRGACDTKGVIAAMIAAGERLLADGIRDFAYLFVVGEETDSIGAKSANVAFRDLGSEYVLVGEPTGSKFARASKGALTCIVRFDGVAAHSAYPHLGDSAINKMVAAIAEINATDWGRDDDLGETTVNVGVVRGGEKPNIIPAKAECEMIFRLVTTPEDVRARLEPILEQERRHASPGRTAIRRSTWSSPTARSRSSSPSTPTSRTSAPSASRCSSAPARSSTPTARTRRSGSENCWKRWRRTTSTVASC